MTPEQKAERRRLQHDRYNRSAKGRARYQRYEDKHPERKDRWGGLRSSDRIRRSRPEDPF